MNITQKSVHTPGPWNYGKRRDGTFWISIPMFTLFDEMPEHYQFDLPTHEANVNLIVAAPRMFDVIDMAIPLLIGWGNDANWDGFPPEYAELINELRAAKLTALGKVEEAEIVLAMSDAGVEELRKARG